MSLLRIDKRSNFQSNSFKNNFCSPVPLQFKIVQNLFSIPFLSLRWNQKVKFIFSEFQNLKRERPPFFEKNNAKKRGNKTGNLRRQSQNLGNGFFHSSSLGSSSSSKIRFDFESLHLKVKWNKQHFNGTHDYDRKRSFQKIPKRIWS